MDLLIQLVSSSTAKGNATPPSSLSEVTFSQLTFCVRQQKEQKNTLTRDGINFV